MLEWIYLILDSNIRLFNYHICGDMRLKNNLNTNADEIFLLFRELHHTPFIYYGKCFLIYAEIKEDEPREFEFLIEHIDGALENEFDLLDYIVNIPGESGKESSILIEGAKKITQHVRYERKPYNRKEAIRV